MIGDAILSMECTVEDVYELGAFENFMVKVKTRFPTKVF